MLAGRCGKNDILQLLMEDEVQCEETQIVALRADIVAGHVDETDLLLRLGAPANKGENEKPIHVVSQLGHVEIIWLLMQYVASLACRNDSGDTALCLAVEPGHLSLVQYLVQLEIEGLDRPNSENETPLYLAA